MVKIFETSRLRLKIGFAVAAVLLPIVLPFLAPLLGIREGGKISMNGIQVLYAVLSSEITLAVYMWGVGNWSRFEPPQITSGSSTPQTGSPTPPAQGPGAPPAPQAGR